MLRGRFQALQGAHRKNGGYEDGDVREALRSVIWRKGTRREVASTTGVPRTSIDRHLQEINGKNLQDVDVDAYIEAMDIGPKRAGRKTKMPATEKRVLVQMGIQAGRAGHGFTKTQLRDRAAKVFEALGLGEQHVSAKLAGCVVHALSTHLLLPAVPCACRTTEQRKHQVAERRAGPQ